MLKVKENDQSMDTIIVNTELEKIEKEIISLKNQTAENIIQIGYKLIEAKEKLQHGEWGDWLRDKIDFSQRTANQFMRIAKEFGSNPEVLTNLGITKIGLLLDVPIEKRKCFMRNHDLKNISTRDLKKAIKQFENRENTVQQQIERFNERISVIDKNIEELTNERTQIINKLKYVYQVLDIKYSLNC